MKAALSGSLIASLVLGVCGFRLVRQRPNSDVNASKSACMDLLIIGDYGTRNSQQRRVAAGMARVAAATQPLAILGIGDNIYPDGAEGSKSLIEKWWSDTYLGHSALRRPWYVVTGNHDWYSDAHVQVDFTTSSRNEGSFWQMPSFWYKRSFSSSSSSIDVFFIDTMIWRKSSHIERYVDRDGEYTRQRNWLKDGLAASTAAWRIVVGHHPVYSAGKHGITGELLDDLDPIMRRYNVAIYISGHDHSQQLIQYEGMDYIVSGAGGKSSGKSENEQPDGSLKEFLKEEGVAGLTICDSSRATLKFYDEDGDVLATRQLTQGAGEPPSPAPTPIDSPTVRRRRRDGDMWSCRRRSSRPGNSDYADTPDGYACIGDRIAPIAPPDVRRRRRNEDMWSCRRRSGSSDTPDGYVCNGDRIVPQAKRAALAPVFHVSWNEVECDGMKLQDVDKRCSIDGCTVLPDRPLSETCEQYCNDHGLACVGAWTQEAEDCEPSAELGCKGVAHESVDNRICQCARLS